MKKLRENDLLKKYFIRWKIWKIYAMKDFYSEILYKLLLLFIKVTSNNFIKKILAKNFNKWRRINKNNINNFNNALNQKKFPKLFPKILVMKQIKGKEYY